MSEFFKTNTTRIAQLCYKDAATDNWIPITEANTLPVGTPIGKPLNIRILGDSGEAVDIIQMQNYGYALKVDINQPTNMDGGKVLVGTTPVEVTFLGVTKSIIISADSLNTGVLYVGKSDVTSVGENAIIFLNAGETLEMDYDDASTAVYVVSSKASQTFWKGALV